jgi:pimeloyl-ACP methyl ester carboxylesterase
MKFAWSFLAILATLWVALTAGLYIWQERLIFVGAYMKQPKPLMHVHWKPISVLTHDGLELTSFEHVGSGDGPIILYFHGNGGTPEQRQHLFYEIPENIGGVIIAGYRGYGGNPGIPSEEDFIRDAERILQIAITKSSGRGIVLWGESLGTGVVAALVGQRHPELRAIVLDAPFTSVSDIASSMFPFIPVRHFIRHPFQSIERLSGSELPALIMHAGDDRVIPQWMGRKILQVLPNGTGVFPDRGGHPYILNNVEGVIIALEFAGRRHGK